MGSPLTGLMLLTVPFLVTTALRTTVPSVYRSQAISGYMGSAYLTSSGGGPAEPAGPGIGKSNVARYPVSPGVVGLCRFARAAQADLRPARLLNSLRVVAGPADPGLL